MADEMIDQLSSKINHLKPKNSALLKAKAVGKFNNKLMKKAFSNTRTAPVSPK